MRGETADRYLRHREGLRRFLVRLTGRPDLAEDLASEVFVRIAQGAVRFDDGDDGRAYLYRVARNLYTDERRRSARRPEVGTDPAALPQPEGGGSPLLRAAIDQAISRLPELEREAFLLREIAGFGYDDIAAVTGGTADAVRSRIFRARVALRDLLGGFTEARS